MRDVAGEGRVVPPQLVRWAVGHVGEGGHVGERGQEAVVEHRRASHQSMEVIWPGLVAIGPSGRSGAGMRRPSASSRGVDSALWSSARARIGGTPSAIL